jgi:hypothetical protein
MTDLLFFILILLLLIFIWGFFILKIFQVHQPLDIEAGKKLIYSTTSGGTIGRSRYRGPLINLRIYEEFIVIASFKVIILNYKDIERVEIRKWMGSIFSKIQLIHNRWNVPKRIVIETRNSSYVKEIIDSRINQENII